MTHLIHHRRSHSWPYCGPGAQLRERRDVPIIKISEPQSPLENRYIAPLVSEDLLDDDVASAGIVRTKIARSHRWFAPRDVEAGAWHSATSTGPLRRIIRPPRDKAQTLFVVPIIPTARDNMVISDHQSQEVPVQSLSTRGRGETVRDGPGHTSAERTHRRYHSEQPRSWREPSASLWTLSEE